MASLLKKHDFPLGTIKLFALAKGVESWTCYKRKADLYLKLFIRSTVLPMGSVITVTTWFKPGSPLPMLGSSYNVLDLISPWTLLIWAPSPQILSFFWYSSVSPSTEWMLTFLTVGSIPAVVNSVQHVCPLGSGPLLPPDLTDQQQALPLTPTSLPLPLQIFCPSSESISKEGLVFFTTEPGKCSLRLGQNALE